MEVGNGEKPSALYCFSNRCLNTPAGEPEEEALEGGEQCREDLQTAEGGVPAPDGECRGCEQAAGGGESHAGRSI